MFGIKKLFSGVAEAASLPADVRAALTDWQARVVDDLESTHFLTRYVVLDIVTDGPDPERHRLTGLAATEVHRGVVAPARSMYLDLLEVADEEDRARRLTAFLQFIGKAPLVVFYAAYVGGFLLPALRQHLGLSLQPRWVDLAWLLPALFADKSHQPMPLDDWLQLFGLDPGEGRRSPNENCLALARLFQMLVVRAHSKGVDTVAALIEESKASSHLRRSH
ncbi:hypothetical protein [Azonexus hydrophilus]|jgi:DNA polymerase-3 subunit epsilon|uniref:hypothetical protein n=1 Tax=Azonexus hydrophilus TaxID=418702 RepID=UPI001963E520|nr:hypothetical protein [Azonexus hydrophilus]